MDGSTAAPAIDHALRAKDGRKPFVMIDGFNLGLEKGTGVATYARNLSYALRDLGCEVGVLYGNSFSAGRSPLLNEVMFFDSAVMPTSRWPRLRRARSLLAPNRNTPFEVPLTGAVVPDSFASRLPYYDSIWNSRDLFDKAHAQFELLRVTNRVTLPRKPDLVHWTYPLPLRVPGVPNIYTLHDLVPLRLPYTTLDRKARYLKLMKWICKTADHIVTVSESSKKDIVDLLGVDPARVTNTYQSVTLPDVALKKCDDAVSRELENTFGLKHKEYFLFYGSIEPKKNISRMLEAYLASGVSKPLVMVGAQAWKSEQELKPLAIDNLRRELVGGEWSPRRVVQLPYVSLPLLTTMIRGARAVLFPSLYEGFGLPVLEAMLLGTPVVTSNVSSIPEIAGEAALLVNPYDGAAISQAIRTLADDSSLCTALIERGRKRASLFSPVAIQHRLADVYDTVLQSVRCAA